VSFLAPHFDYDVFVSYSHGDPRGTGGAPLKRWTTGLIRELGAEIRDTHTDFDDLHVWFDEQIDPTAHLTEELRRKVRSSAILMIVMSPRYLASSWCKEELGWFEEQVAARAHEQGRVFVIHALPTDGQTWPAFLRDERGHTMPGYFFYDRDSSRGDRHKPFGWGLPNIRDDGINFSRMLSTLEGALTLRLREIKTREEARAAPPPPPPAPPPRVAVRGGTAQRVYLHVRNGQGELGDRVRGGLAKDGLDAVGPIDAAALLGQHATERDARIAVAQQCAALALVRADDDASFVGDLCDIGVDERMRMADKRGGVPLPCAVLDGSGARMPFDVSPFGIRRFDLGRETWPGEFLAWVKEAQGQAAGPG
jgi:hypothetical protein